MPEDIQRYDHCVIEMGADTALETLRTMLEAGTLWAYQGPSNALNPNPFEPGALVRAFVVAGPAVGSW